MTTNVTAISTSALSKVDSLYGPGTLLGWYLTIAACFVSWTLHPKKSKRDSIDPDFVMSLTLPVAAVVHLISQVSKLPKPQNSIHHSHNGTNIISQETADAIEAPLVVIEAFMNIAATMFIVAALSFKIRRALFAGLAGLVSFATDCFLHMSDSRSPGLGRLFSRSFVADSAVALIVIGVDLGVLTIASFVVTWMLFYNFQRDQTRQIRDAEAETQSLMTELSTMEVASAQRRRPLALFRSEMFWRRASKSNLAVWSPYLTWIFSIVPAFLSLIFQLGQLSASRQPTPFLTIEINPKAPGFLDFWFPKSNSSFKDLDQKVAIFAGLTTLAFSLYPVLSGWYATWKKDQVRELQLRRRENLRLRRLISEGQRGGPE